MDIIGIVAAIIMIPIFAVIGKLVLDKNDNDKEQKNENGSFALIFKYIIYIIVGAFLIWLFTTVWFSIVGHNESDSDFQKYK